MKAEPDSLEITTNNPEETGKLGVCLGRLAQAGDVFLLVGDLGSGKTCLTQGIARGLDINEYAASPTFVLVRELHGRLPLYHIDLYRLDRLEEIADLGLDVYLYGDGVCVIEWAEKGLKVLPEEHLLVWLSYVSDTERRLKFEPKGRRYLELVGELRSCR